MRIWMLACLLSSVLMPSLLAQDLTIPSNLASQEGNTFNVWPFRENGSVYQLYIHRSRLNQWSVATEFTGIGFRLNGDRDTYNQDMDFVEYNISVSESDAASFAANQLASTVYADNIGPNEVAVRSGPLFIPANSFTDVGSPNPFSYIIDFSTPYMYTPGTDLVITIRHTGSQVPISASIQQMRVDSQTETAGITWAVGGSVFTSTSGVNSSGAVVKLMTPPAPQVNLASPTGSVSYNSTSSVNGAVATETTAVTYTITNTGSDVLNLDPMPVTASGEVNCAVNVTQPATLILPVSASTTFEVQITPQAVGPFEVSLEIASDAPRDNPFLFKAAGDAASGAWIEVYRGGVFIANGALDTMQRDKLSAFNLVYGIQNQGTQNLAITSPVTVTNEQGCAVQITQPTSPIAPQGEEALTLNIAPAGAGSFSFSITVESNDFARTPYTFNVSGTAEEKGESSSDEGGGCTACGDSLPWIMLALTGSAALTRRRLRGVGL